MIDGWCAMLAITATVDCYHRSTALVKHCPANTGPWLLSFREKDPQKEKIGVEDKEKNTIK